MGNLWPLFTNKQEDLSSTKARASLAALGCRGRSAERTEIFDSPLKVRMPRLKRTRSLRKFGKKKKKKRLASPRWRTCRDADNEVDVN